VCEHCIILALLYNVAINFNKKDTHMKFKHIMLGSILALSITSIANASIIVIDDFSTEQLGVTAQSPATGASPNSSGWLQAGSVSDTSIIGGFRDLRVTAYDPAPDASSSIATAFVTGNEFSFSSGSGVLAQFDIRWDGASTGDNVAVNGLNNFDLSNESGTRFFTPIISADLNAWFSVTFWSDQLDDGMFKMETRNLYIPGHSRLNPADNTLNDPRQSFFTDDIFALTNFSKVGAIQVSGNIVIPDINNAVIATTDVVALNDDGNPIFEGSRIGDYDLRLTNTFATEVSAPGTLAVLLSGVFGLLMTRRRA